MLIPLHLPTQIERTATAPLACFQSIRLAGRTLDPTQGRLQFPALILFPQLPAPEA
jgi:hypothetical protein